MRLPLLATIVISGAAPALHASAPDLTTSFRSRPMKLAYQRMSTDGDTVVKVYNFSDSKKVLSSTPVMRW